MTRDMTAFLAEMREDLARRRMLDRIRHDELAQRQNWGGSSKGKALSATPTGAPSPGQQLPPVSVVRGATVVHHVTLLSTFNQSIAAGGGRLRWEWWSEGPPNQRRGFTTLAASGPPTFRVPVDITGELEFILNGTWGEEQDGGETAAAGRMWREPGPVTVKLFRDGALLGERTYPAGRVTSSRYTVSDDGWEVVAGDEVEVILPNSSAEAQRHRQAELVLSIIELAQAVVQPPGVANLVATQGEIRPLGEGYVDLPATTVGGQTVNAGDLLVAIVETNFTGGGGIDGPAGWTEHVAVSTSGSGDNASVTVASRIATGAEASTYRWTHVGAINNIGGVMHLIPGGAVAGTASQAWSNDGTTLPVGPVGAGTLWLAGTVSESSQSLARATQIEPGNDITSFTNGRWWQLDDDAVHDLTVGDGSLKAAYAAVGVEPS